MYTTKMKQQRHTLSTTLKKSALCSALLMAFSAQAQQAAVAAEGAEAEKKIEKIEVTEIIISYLNVSFIIFSF